MNRPNIERIRKIKVKNEGCDHKLSFSVDAEPAPDCEHGFPGDATRQQLNSLKTAIQALSADDQIAVKFELEKSGKTPSNRQDQIDVLKLFIETVETIDNSSFLTEMKEKGTKVEFQLFTANFEAELSGTREESLRAVLLSYRFLSQDNEFTSLRNMSAMLEEMDDVPPELLGQFTAIKTELNKEISNDTNVEDFGTAIVGLTNLPPISKYQLYDTFLYGLYAHANPTKRRLILLWKQNGAVFESRKAEFFGQVLHLSGWLTQMKEVVQQIHDQLPENTQN